MWRQANGKAPYSQGVFYKKPEKLPEMLDNKASFFELDSAVSHTPTTSETLSVKRYKAAFAEIIKTHIASQAVPKQTIVLVSHSDGINPFLAQTNQPEISNPCYCATFAIEFEVGGDGEVSIRKDSAGAEKVYII